MKHCLIVALHGFLGLTSDWNFLKSEFGPKAVESVDLFEICPPEEGLAAWGRSFNEYARQKTKPLILLAYSLGARLAMHALTQNPSQWDAAILISGHPGIDDERVKKERAASDCMWADRFLKEEWHLLMQSWNRQEVFKGSAILPRPEEMFSREQLSRALRGWSVGHQQNLSHALMDLNIPLLWIAGSLDSGYASRAASMKFSHPFSKTWIAPNAGHRVPWDVQKSLIQEIMPFIINHEAAHAYTNREMGRS